MNRQVLSPAIFAALGKGAGLIVPNAQRQAQVRAAWAEAQRRAGRAVWTTPRVTTFVQLAEERVRAQSGADDLPDPLLPPAAEWAAIRELSRDSGGIAEARALLASVRTLADWRLPRSAAALGGSPEAELLKGALRELEMLATREQRRPLRELVESLPRSSGDLVHAGMGAIPPLAAAAFERLGVAALPRAAAEPPAVALAAAENDEHEIELIAGWCRAHLERNPEARLLIVDARLRARRRDYERALSQTLTPSEWTSTEARRFSNVFAIEGGQPLTDFPLIAHALLTLRLLTSRLAFHDIVRWLRLPFRDGEDLFAGAAIEADLRAGKQFEYGAAELAGFLDRDSRREESKQLAAQLRQAATLLSGERRSPAEWSPRLLAALRAMGWHGSRTLRSDEQQTVARLHTLLDEYSALGAWLPPATAAMAVDTLADLAAERSFDPASAIAPVTLTDSHDDPVVGFDGVWVAGLDAAQWPPPPRPDVFIPQRLQIGAGIPWASAAGQTRLAHESLAAWRAAAGELVCSWARLDGDAHRIASPLLARFETGVYTGSAAPSLARALGAALTGALGDAPLETFDDSAGSPVDRSKTVKGGVRPLTLQAECGFRAYAEVRLRAEELEAPQPGIDRRDRGMLLHKALELVWLGLQGHFAIKVSEPHEWRPLISGAVEAAIASVYRGRIPVDLMHAVDRERMRLERLIEQLLQKERERTPFEISAVESQREVSIASGHFELRIDRIDRLEGGGFAILDYKSGEPRRMRWSPEEVRDPQLLAYLLAERGRDVQALANVWLASNRATFTGRAARQGLLPGVTGLSASKIPADEIDAAWHTDTSAWIGALQGLAEEYLAGLAPVEPAADVCRRCRLTVLCRRLELAADDAEEEGTHE